ncbi:hypothetical protein Q765_01260 [Flavobacterium rivuli WB 3.3-2 = DSM 21788]|uniref:Uncharacterized protein n=1 Tax=Flavobacterium rivuli WB 3.3-2 = DSM 21788 TaxID=1121895 RepID=A0A0A2MJR7_9FLAO|nr:hypothetical protein [Flavobacterium rivuli]KGO88565.1 hypothetical protein Q765_01260 [Flavobacterium rivuli WB 3.3-2 = DSM 21788]
MKLFSFIVSVVMFITTLFFFISDFPDITTFNGTVYLLLLVVLLLICLTGIIINKPVFVKHKRKYKMSLK